MNKLRGLTLSVLAGLAVTALMPAAALAGFGIDPGKVYIDNLSPGTQADVPITLLNQNNYQAAFTVAPKQPDYTADGYEAFTSYDWISITPNKLSVPAGGKAVVTVTIVMPENSRYSGKKAEAWIAFTEQTTEMVKVQVASRLFISTRSETPTPAPAPSKPAAGKTPAVQTEGAVGITVEPKPEADKTSSGFPWAIAAVLAVIALGGLGMLIVRRKRT